MHSGALWSTVVHGDVLWCTVVHIGALQQCTVLCHNRQGPVLAEAPRMAAVRCPASPASQVSAAPCRVTAAVHCSVASRCTWSHLHQAAVLSLPPKPPVPKSQRPVVLPPAGPRIWPATRLPLHLPSPGLIASGPAFNADLLLALPLPRPMITAKVSYDNLKMIAKKHEKN